jgi:hypothetical protein
MEHRVSRDLIAVEEKASPRAYRDVCDFGANTFPRLILIYSEKGNYSY